MHTRRALLAAAPALSALATTPAKANPDDALLTLCRRHAEAARKCEAAELALIAAEETAAPQRPGLPDAYKVRAGDWFRMVDPIEPGRFHTPSTVDRWERALRLGHYRNIMTPGAAGRFKARGRELIAARNAHRQAVKAVDAAYGLRAAQVRADRLGRALTAVEHRLLETPATTLDGLRAKARVVAGIIGPPDGTYEDHATRALLADLLSG